MPYFPFLEASDKLVEKITILSMEFGWSYSDYQTLSVKELNRYLNSLLEIKKVQGKVREEQSEELFSKYSTNKGKPSNNF